MHLIDGDFENGIYLKKWMAIYTCFETVEYKEISSGRPVSYRELQLKASMSPKEYLKLKRE
jgi:hypothetical protein